MIIHLEPSILECKVKCITTNKASGGDGIPVELLQILKDDAVKVLHSICQQFGKLSSGHRTGKGQCSFQSQRKAMPKNVQSTVHLYSSHTLTKQCSKFSKPGFNSTWAVNFQMFKLDLEKTEEPEIKLPTYIVYYSIWWPQYIYCSNYHWIWLAVKKSKIWGNKKLKRPNS